MLLGYANSLSNINLCVEFFVPLRVGHCQGSGGAIEAVPNATVVLLD
jgi:hypothetical protein